MSPSYERQAKEQRIQAERKQQKIRHIIMSRRTEWWDWGGDWEFHIQLWGIKFSLWGCLGDCCLRFKRRKSLKKEHPEKAASVQYSSTYARELEQLSSIVINARWIYENSQSGNAGFCQIPNIYGVTEKSEDKYIYIHILAECFVMLGDI